MKFSIITPSYNQGKFIEQTIQSVLSQKGNFEIEYIIIDGKSSDNSIEIIKKYDRLLKNNKLQIKCNGIKLIWWSKKDKGQADAINQGFKKATGDIIAWINSDDYYAKNTFTKVQNNFILNPNNLWLTGYCNIVNEYNQKIQKYITKYKNWWLNHYSYNKLLITNFIRQPATFWRKEILDTIGLLDEKLDFTMDYDYWLRIGKKYQPVVVKECLSNFRIHTQSKGGLEYKKQFSEDLNLSIKYSKNKIIPYLHSIHNLVIVLIYKIIK